MLIGGKIQHRGKTATLLFASTSASALNEAVEKISSLPGNYTEITEPKGRDRMMDDNYSGMKMPMFVVIHESEEQREDFISVNDVTILDRSEWEYHQERQALEDQIEQDRDIQEMVNLDAFSGVENNTSVAKRLGIDENDEWDTRTAKEKADDAAASSAHYNRLVAEGIVTDEAIAPSYEQAGQKEQAILDAIENIKNGMNFIDPNNIPQPIQDQIDELIKNGELEPEDVGDYVDEINKKVKEDCESGDLSRISRIFGDVRVDETGVKGGTFHVTLKNNDSPTSKKRSDLPKDTLTEKLLQKKSDDEIADIMKPSTIDGSLKKDVSKFILDNTSLDMYDFKEALGSSNTTEEEKDFDESSLPKNIGPDSGIDYDSSTKEYAVVSNLIDEDSDLRIFSLMKIGDVTASNVIGTNNVESFFVADGHMCYTRKEKDYGTSYFTFKVDGNTVIYNVNI